MSTIEGSIVGMRTESDYDPQFSFRQLEKALYFFYHHFTDRLPSLNFLTPDPQLVATWQGSIKLLVIDCKVKRRGHGGVAIEKMYLPSRITSRYAGLLFSKVAGFWKDHDAKS